MTTIILILAIVLVALAGHAAEQTPSAPTRLEPVIVETERVAPERIRTDEETRQELQRVPGGVDLVPQRRIEESRGANLKDALDFVPGVLVRPRVGAADESQLSMRGSGLRSNFHLRGVNVLIDGFPYGQADGFSDFESLELLTTKRIEIYKGGNALRFGGNTLGGALNLVTKTGHDVGPLELRIDGGSFGYVKGYVGTGWVWDPFDVYLGVSATEIDGFREHSQQARSRFYSTFGYNLGGGASLRFDLSYVRNEEELPGALTQRELDRDRTQADPANLSLRDRAARNYDYVRGAFTLRVPVGEAQTLEWATQLNYQDMDHPLSFAVIDQTTYSWSTELRHTLSAPLFGRANRLTTGLQYAGTRQIDVNLANGVGTQAVKIKNQVNEAMTLGAYLEEQLDLTEALTTLLGGRVQYSTRTVRDRLTNDGGIDVDGNDSDSVDFLSASPKVGFVWRVTPEIQVFGNASHSYEPPLLLEVTAPGQFQGSLSQLDAQKAWQFELGTRGALGKRVTWDLSVYDIELEDEIQNLNVFVRVNAFFGFTVPRFQNIRRSRHTGVEAGLDLLLLEDVARRIGLGSAGDSLRSRTAYTWSRFVFVGDRAFGNNRLPGAPEHFIQSELRYDHLSGFWVAPGVEVIPHGYFVNNENDARTQAYTLFNLKLGYDWKPGHVSVFLEARNLTDVTYASSVVVNDVNRRFFEPGEPRAFYAGVSWRWK